MKKIFTMMAVMLLSATSLMAQNPDKGLSWAVEMGVGTELELGGRAQYNFNKYIAIEGVAKYAFDYGDYSHNEITLQAGARAFSPEFCSKNPMKAFLALDMGYGAAFKDGNNGNNFALDMTLGMYLYKGLYAGYGFGGLFNDGSHKDHVFRIGYNF